MPFRIRSLLLLTIVLSTPGMLEAESFTITSAAEVPAPNGAPANRTTVGVCEVIRFTASERADWTVEGPDDLNDWGTPVFATNQSSFEWQASSLPGVFTITAKPHSEGGYASYETASINMNVICPTAVRLVDNNDVTWYRPTFAGAGFKGRVLLLPLRDGFALLK